MCGRYTLFTDEEYQDIRKIIRAVQEKGHEVKTGEIYPTNPAPILVWEGKETVPQAVKWGWPKFQGSGVLINARAETAEEKNLFRKSVYTRRCVVPTTGFYEWDADKRRYLFRMPARTELYMAALYGVFGGEARYCILTTQANASVAPVHHRMPLVLRAQEVRPWLEDEQTARRLLHETPPELERRETDGQLRLW